MVFGCVGFCRIWYTRVYQNMTSSGGLAPRRLHGWLWPVEVARWLGSTLGDMNHKPMASPSMVCTFYLPCITPQNVQFGTPGCTGSRQLDSTVICSLHNVTSRVWAARELCVRRNTESVLRSVPREPCVRKNSERVSINSTRDTFCKCYRYPTYLTGARTPQAHRPTSNAAAIAENFLLWCF